MNDPKQQLDVIKEILAERTKFHALSGLSGVLAGFYALAGSYFTYTLINEYDSVNETNTASLVNKLFGVAIGVLVLSLCTGLYSSYKKSEGRLFSNAAKLLMKELTLFLTIGGFVILSCIKFHYFNIVSPLSLIFYGMTLLHVSTILHKEVKHLGLILVVLGIVGLFLPEYGLLIWAFGFGIMHIIYGFVMWVKYEQG